MATASYTKSETTIITHQHVTHPNTITSSEQDSTTDIHATIFCYHGRLQTGNTNPGSFIIEFKSENSTEETWEIAWEFTVSGNSVASESLTSSEPAGETVIALADTEGFEVKGFLIQVPPRTRYVYIADTADDTNSEWATIVDSDEDASVTIMDGLTSSKDSSDTIFDEAECFVAELDLIGIVRWRVRFSHEGVSGSDAGIQVLAVVTTDLFI